MPDCDIWGTVDFGEGPVRIRCTQKGTHAHHRTEVFIYPDERSTMIPNTKNIFEED